MQVRVQRGVVATLGVGVCVRLGKSLWRARKASRRDGQRILECGLTFATRARLSVAVQPTAPQTSASGAAVIVGGDGSPLGAEMTLLLNVVLTRVDYDRYRRGRHHDSPTQLPNSGGRQPCSNVTHTSEHVSEKMLST